MLQDLINQKENKLKTADLEDRVNISLVTYHTSPSDIFKLIESINQLESRWKLIIIDNSLNDEIGRIVKGLPNVEYIFNNANLGFGAGHNIAIRRSLNERVKYHLVINPDVFFKGDPLRSMIDYMTSNHDVGMMMPQVLNLDGSVQNLPKLLPTPFSIFMRKIKFPSQYYQKFINRYELRFVDQTKTYNAPILSGCFTLLRVEAVANVGFYDDNYFMYFEDWDLSRRVHEQYKTIYFPVVSVYHGYESGANKNSRLFGIYLKSFWLYFNKWGWISDEKRRIINRQTLSQF